MGLFLVQLIVLGEVVGRADNVESLLDGSVLVGIRRESLRDRILRLIRMQRIRDWALRGFVVFRERTVGDGADGHKQTADAFRVHDEWTHASFWVGIRFEIGNVVAHPLLFALAPPDLLAVWIPGFAVEIAGGAVVEDTPIHRPRPRPVGMNAKTRRIFRAAALRQGTGLGP
jgi:hypothetical protein